MKWVKFIIVFVVVYALIMAGIFGDLGIVPAALIIAAILFGVRFSTKKNMENSLLKTAGILKNDKSCFIFFNLSSGVVLNPSEKTITLADTASTVKKYRYDEIRSWSNEEETAGETIGVGLQAGMAALGANTRAKARARANTGLFISVKDINHPVYRIGMQNKKDRQKWFEILTQELNEDGVNGANSSTALDAAIGYCTGCGTKYQKASVKFCGECGVSCS